MSTPAYTCEHRARPTCPHRPTPVSTELGQHVHIDSSELLNDAAVISDNLTFNGGVTDEELEMLGRKWSCPNRDLSSHFALRYSGSLKK
jgi:hypothetical protein